jgi:hippurate hydrolase
MPLLSLFTDPGESFNLDDVVAALASTKSPSAVHEASSHPTTTASPASTNTTKVLPPTPPILSSVFSTAAILRRELHSYPEAGFEEHNTQRLLKSSLTSFCNIPTKDIRHCAGTGLVVDIHGTGPIVSSSTPSTVKCVAFRADMDGLRMVEGNHFLPYRSKNTGVAHMCGHDGHMAGLIAAAKLIADRRHRMPSDTTVRLLFQPAEEGPGGALPMIKQGALKNVDEVYGLHNWPTLSLGTVACRPGAVMAHVSTWTITLSGKGIHASQPHGGLDVVTAGATLVTNLNTIISRSVPYHSQAVLSVTQFHTGNAFNVLPDTATLAGTIRDFDPEVFEIIKTRITEIAHGTAATFGVTADVAIEELFPALVNHDEPTKHVQAVAKGADLAMELVPGEPTTVAEDFSFFLMPEHGGVPGCFLFVGTNEERYGKLGAFDHASAKGDVDRSNCMCHSSDFDFNDNALPVIAGVFVKLAERRLGCKLYEDGEVSYRAGV